MKIVRLAGLVLAAVMALSLLAVSAASAEPLFNPASGTFTELSNTATLSAAGNEVICEKSLGPGAIDSPHLILIIIHFLNCSGKEVGGSTCSIKSTGTAAGLILTETLHGILGLILPNIPAILILPIASATFVTLAGPCILTTKVTGNVTGEISPVGVSVQTGKVVLGANVNTHFIASLGGLTLAKLLAFSTAATEEVSATIDWAQLTEVT